MPSGRRGKPRKAAVGKRSPGDQTPAPPAPAGWRVATAIGLCAAFLYVYFAPMAPPRVASTGVAASTATGPRSWFLHSESERVYFRDAAIGEAISGLLDPAMVVASWRGPGQTIGLFDRLPILAVAAAIGGVAWCAGDALLAALGLIGRLGRLERVVFAAVAGLPVVSTLSLLIGLAGLLQNRGAFVAAAAACLGARFWALRRVSPKLLPPAENAAPSEPKTPSVAWAYWVIGALSLLIAAEAMLPPIDFDVREYHLQTPKEWYAAGRISYLPHNVYGNMPLGAESLALPAMALLGDWRTGALAGKLLMAALAPLTALGLMTAGKRFFSDPAAGAFAGVLYLAAPWTAYLSVNGLVEPYWTGLGFFAAYALAAAWQERAAAKNVEDASPSDFGWFAAAGWFAGAATACKYPALVFLLAPAAFVAGGIAQRRPGKALAATLLAAAVACGPWFAKNVVLIGNPVYPLAQRLFPVADRPLELARQWGAAHRPPSFHPSAIFYNAADSLVVTDWTSPVLLPLAIAAVLLSRRRKAVAILWAVVGFLLVEWWVLTHRIDRFLIPVLPFLALAAGMALAVRAGSSWKIAGGVLTGVAVMIGGLFTACGVMSDARILSPLVALFRDSGEGEVLGRANPWHVYFNDQRTPGAAVLTVGDAEVFDLAPPVLYSTCFDPCVFEQLARDKSPEEVRAALRERNVEFVYVNWPEIDRYRSPGNYGFTDWVQPEVFKELEAAGVLQRLPEAPNRPRDAAYRVVGNEPD